MKTVLLIAAIMTGYVLNAQPAAEKIRLYIDCQQVSCEMDFLRQQLPIADFVRDRQTSDVHIMITAQFAGNGGRRYNIQLIGQQRFAQLTDTCSFFTQPAQTANEIRDLMICKLKTALVPFLIKAGQAAQVTVSFPTAAKDGSSSPAKDKWNYWVISLGGYVNFSGDKNYRQTSLEGNFSASRTTDKSKIDFMLYSSTSRNAYTLEESGTKSVLKTTNDYLEARHNYVKSITPRWSLAYEVEFNKSTYDNIHGGIAIDGGVEYNIFPYKASSSKFLVIRYEVGAEKRKYVQETIYNKTSETLFYHDLGVYAAFTQPWGSIRSNITWYNYLHDVSKNNLSFYANAEVRLFKGFSLNFYGQASIINDQLSLAKGGATSEEILLRLKALSTNFNYYTGIGLNYRFGSQYNNFVNPRFTNGR
jgi:hypothetical protein